MTDQTTRRDLAKGMAIAVVAGAAVATHSGEAHAQGRGRVSAGAADSAVRAAHRRYADLNEGANADYIPALAQVNSRFFGVSLVTTSGSVHSVGDDQQAFSIQSISKVFTMAQVLKESGAQRILDTVGVDATGQVFNSITAVEQYRGKEMNPLVNPGAIATTGNVIGSTPDEVWAKIIAIHNDFAGRQLEVNQEVYASEAATNQRNRAIGELMHAYERFNGDPQVATDLYTRQCSINVTSRDLGVMAATLANGGRNPVTNRQVLEPQHVAEVLAVMATAGLYDDSGKWLFRTGLPAKSGVGGGIIAVSPGKFGIGTFAPPLDQAGNSVRGQNAIADISNALGGNPYLVTGGVS
jgi:glutaminase